MICFSVYFFEVKFIKNSFGQIWPFPGSKQKVRPAQKPGSRAKSRTFEGRPVGQGQKIDRKRMNYSLFWLWTMCLNYQYLIYFIFIFVFNSYRRTRRWLYLFCICSLFLKWVHIVIRQNKSKSLILSQFLFP